MVNPEWLRGVPEAIQPVYHCERVNQPILLLSGRVRIVLEELEATGEGVIYLDWLPRPDVRVWLYPEKEFHDALGLRPFLADGFQIEFPDENITLKARWSNSYWHPKPEAEYEIPATVAPLFTIGAAQELDYAILHLVNFPNYAGAGICEITDEITEDIPKRQIPWYSGRLELRTPEWHITIDRLPNFHEFEKQLSGGGYAITHAAKVERVNGKSFRPRQLQSLLTPLGMFLSFARGSWCAPVLAVGFSKKHGRVWEMWETPDMFRIPSRPATVSWFPEQCPEEISDLFAQFHKMWRSDEWQEVLRMALGYYFFANAPDADREAQLIIGQAALELFAHAILVDKERALSSKGFDELTAADKIRLLQMWAGMPKEIPDSLDMLKKAAKQENWQDSADAITGLRNLLAHPNRQKIRNYFGKPGGAAWGATQVALWCFELVLLRLLGYEGRYYNRTKQLVSTSVEPVPWAQANAQQEATTHAQSG